MSLDVTGIMLNEMNESIISIFLMCLMWFEKQKADLS